MSLEDSIEAMADAVNITTADWEEAKQEIEDKLKSLTIDPDMNPSTMKHLIGDLDDLMTELRFRLVDIEGQVEFINAQVDYIRSTNSKGSNAEERKTVLDGFDAFGAKEFIQIVDEAYEVMKAASKLDLKKFTVKTDELDTFLKEMGW